MNKDEKKKEEPKDKNEGLKKLGVVALLVIVIGSLVFMQFTQYGSPAPSKIADTETPLCKCAKNFGWECKLVPVTVSEKLEDNRINLINCKPVVPCNMTAEQIIGARSVGCVYGNGDLEIWTTNENGTQQQANDLKQTQLSG